MKPLFRRWSLTTRALAVAAGAVGMTAVVIAVIFSFALMRASETASNEKNRSIAFSAMHFVEEELAHTSNMLRQAGKRALGELAGEPVQMLDDMRKDDMLLVWAGLLTADGRLVAQSGRAPHALRGDPARLVAPAGWRNGTDLNVVAQALPGRHHGGSPPRRLAIQYSLRLADGRILAAVYDSRLVHAVRQRILDALHLDAGTCLQLVGPGLPMQASCVALNEPVIVSPPEGFILQSLGWKLGMAQPSAGLQVPGYAFALTLLAVGLGVSFAARGIGWASSPALVLADSASHRLELEGLLARGELPPDLQDLARQLVSLHHVSERRTAQLEEMLGEAYRRFDEMTRNFPGVIFRRHRDASGKLRYSYVSASCEKYYGVTAEEILRDFESCMRNFHPEDARRLASCLHDAPDDMPMLYQYRVTGSDGRERWMQTSTQPFRIDHGPTIWEGVAVDVTALKQAESRELELREKAVAENMAKSRFLAVMSHEIRNPLNSIAGYARLIHEQEGIDPAIADHARVIEQSSQYLKLLVNDVLDFSKTEAGGLRLESKPFALQEMADMLAGHVKVLSHSAAVRFSMQLSPGLPRVLGDRVRLTQILMNLLTNAFKFTTFGGVMLQIRELSREARHCVIRLSVSDTGIGIESGQLERLFKPFEQGDGSSSRRFGGWGLGLAIAQRLAGLMGSSVKVESTPGKGSLFWLDVRLPLDTRGKRRLPASRPKPRQGTLKVLIADDNEINARLLSSMLSARGYDCTTVDSGQHALAQVENGNFDVLLLDIDMPEMDGYEVAERLRANGGAEGSGLRIIAITGNAFAEDVERALAAGIDNHLAKPVDFDALFQMLQEEEDVRGIAGSGVRP